jgi:predicted dehydrogenase
LKYDAQAAAAFYDEYGEREWTRFEDDRTPAASVATHTHYLLRFVAKGDPASTAGTCR